LAAGNIFLANLNEIDSAAGSFGDFRQQGAGAGGFVAGKLMAIGNVTEEQVPL
jgi:hypothetical protein